MATIEQIKAEREEREAVAHIRAQALEPGDYYASGEMVMDHKTRQPVCICETHWDACLVMLYARKVV